MKKGLIRALLIFLCPLLIFSCTAKRTPKDIFEEYSQAYDNLYSGSLYSSDAMEWEDGYLSDDLFSSLYDEPNKRSEREKIEKCAVYLSSSMDRFCEVGIFLCYGNGDAESVAKMCHRRIFLVSETQNGGDYSARESSSVMIFGRYVIYTIQPNKKESEKAILACFD